MTVKHDALTPTTPTTPICLLLSEEQLNRIRQWFDAVQDISPSYLEKADFILAKSVYTRLGMRVPHPILRHTEASNT